MKSIKSSIWGRIIIAFIAVSLTVSFSFTPKKTEAWVGISDVSIDSAASIAAYLEKVWKAYLAEQDWWKSWILDPIFYAVAQELLSDLTESTVNWINSGFEGSPLYDVNFADSITNGLNEASGLLIDKMGGADICGNLREGLSASFSYEAPYEVRMKCTLTDVIDNVDNFYDDFTTGGWRTWVTMTTNPQNNPYGSYITTSAEYDKMRAEKAKEVKNEITAGGGFKSFKKCDEYSKKADGTDSTSCKHWTIQTPGKTIEARMTKATGVDFGALQVADEMDEIIGALLQQAMKAIFEEGSSSDSSGTSGGGGLTNADVSQDVTPATIQEDMAALRINLQIYYDYFTATSTALTNGLHSEMRDTILTQYIREENYWRLAQYCVNKGTVDATGIEGNKYMEKIVRASENEIKADDAKGFVQTNINEARGLYSEGFEDTSGNSWLGVYDPTYTSSSWSNVTSKILSAWENKLSSLKGIQQKDTGDLKMSRMGKESAKDVYDDKCCDIDFGTALLCTLNPFCSVCSVSISLLDEDVTLFDACDTLCPCLAMEDECAYKTGPDYRSCASVGGTQCQRGEKCIGPAGVETGTQFNNGGESESYSKVTPYMRPTLDHTFCCIGGTCTPSGPYQYGETPTPGPEEPEPVVPNQCAEDMETCTTTFLCCNTTANTCGHTSGSNINYCYPTGTAGLIPIGGGGEGVSCAPHETPPAGTPSLDQITWLTPGSPAGFEQNATLNSVNVSSDNLHISWAGSRSEWYAEKNFAPCNGQSGCVDGNIWVIGYINGKWQAGAFEWLLKGAGSGNTELQWQEFNSTDATFIQAGDSPINSLCPEQGDKVGFMQSSMLRGGTRPTPTGRSNIVWTTWPATRSTASTGTGTCNASSCTSNSNCSGCSATGHTNYQCGHRSTSTTNYCYSQEQISSWQGTSSPFIPI